MSRNTTKTSRILIFRSALISGLCGLLIFAASGSAIVNADSYQDQINALNAQNNQIQGNISSLQLQAQSYQAAINQLQSQIDGLQASININESKQAQIQQQIAADKAEIVQQKQVLGQDIKAMYLDNQMTTIEELATSKNLSAFVDAQTYGNAVQNKIQQTLAQITSLNNQLTTQSAQISQLIKVSTAEQSQLASTQNQQSQLLSYNQSQQDSYNQQVQSNQKQISVLQAEQIAANRKLVSSNGGQVVTSGSCGGGYPAVASGPAGNWGCNYSLDSSLDNWGMYNRECVSYTAWMVYKTYGYMPYWGGSGDANQWPADARAAGIPVGYTPKVGSVAIFMGGSSDPWGHAMWVTAVNGNMITVDQYNLYYDGNFYETTIDGSGLTYIYFGQ